MNNNNHIHMDLRVGFDEDFTIEGQSMPCSSASSSFSSASTASSSQDPFTPTSGRSTPGLRPMMIDHESVACGTSGGFGLTPPTSAFGGYFPNDVKADFPNYMNCGGLSATPSRKSSMPTNVMDFDYTSIMPTTLASQSNPTQSTNPQALGHYPFADQMTSSPLVFPTPPYPYDSNTCDVSATWAWPGDSPVSFFDRRDSPALSSPVKDLGLRERNNMTPSFLIRHGRRRLCVEEVQQKTSALQQVQQHGQRVHVKRERGHNIGITGPIVSVPRGNFYCQHPDCLAGNHKPYKRQEHLKRHTHSQHTITPKTKCEFCVKEFNRRDNYRQHLYLHTLQGRAITRTDYYPGAQAVYDAEMKRTKQRSQPKSKVAIPKRESKL
ncbi:Uu.00g076680.m01.CDS01 [Anthostomella pinea]|uniref:Uu.00g076680.m01.CDS01 n=1 Tax=Anthostomella pinea TaxID=933095 RepID=A0AAI8VX41_9PEZI|nr:Uu.00g076680.m01.CDS01 [Anthostomella pinea]